MKKIFTLLFSLVATTTLWAHDFEVNSIYYNFLADKTKEVEVTYRGSNGLSYSNEYSGSVTIPSTVTYNGTTYSVTSIGEQAFRGCSGLTSVTIPNSVTSIGDYAFYMCSSLTSITIPNSVTSIGNIAFYGCSSLPVENSLRYADTYLVEAVDKTLSTYSIKEGTKWIGSYAFSHCFSLTSITIPNSVTSIGEGAFFNCGSLASITFPNSVTSIGYEAFAGCSGLTSIIVEDANSTYDSRENCNAIIETASNTLITGCKNTIIPNSVTSIGDYAFEYCKGLTSITIPNSVTSIGNSAFYDCSGLTSITIPNSVTSIGSSAFYDCDGLTSITIPNSVTSIGSYAFADCSGLTSVVVEEGNTVYDSRENCNAIIETATNTLITGCQNTTIPNSVTSIGDEVFRGCSSLTSITIPNSVTSIGDYAFCGCSGLTSITIPNSVTSIGDGAFDWCSGLTSITIGNSVTSIGAWAFQYCSGLTSITIPNSVTSIGDGAFKYCSGLTSITIGNSVTSIGKEAFRDCSSLTSITIPNSVTSIGNWAFYDCDGLTSIESLAEVPPTLGSSAFDNVSTTTPVYVPCSSVSAYQSAYGWNTFTNIQGLLAMYSIAVDVNDSIMGTSQVDYNKCEGAQITANHNNGYHFVQWSDGNTDNPRTLELTQDTTLTAEFAPNQYQLSLATNNSEMGSVQGAGTYDYLTEIEISATANYRYRFVQWSDGNTDNPRTLELTQDTILTAEFAVSYSGQCGDDLYWAYDEDSKKISITGSGDMYDYTPSTQPWLFFQEQITEVTTSNTTTSIGTSAFEGCIRLGKVSLSYAMENIAANAFAECKRLYDIYVYVTYPPFAEESSFANYNVYLYIPCENQRDYILDVVWGNFKYIECMGAESDDTGGDDVTVAPGSTDVTITWPTEENADTYSIVIKKDGKVVCTLTFNSEGQLLNIAFAPGREGNHPAQYAEATTNGYRFTVTGLEEGTDYTYTVTSKDAANKTISEHSGKFTTQSTTALENTHSQSANCQKILRDGHLLIIRDGKTYNAQGVEL